MQYSAVQFGSVLFLLVGTALVITSIATSYWSSENSGLAVGDTRFFDSHRGLWEKCHRFVSPGVLSAGLTDGFHCSNRFKTIIDRAEHGDFNLQNSDVQAWEIAVLALMSLSAVISVISLIFSPCCCNRWSCCLTFWVLIAALCSAAGVGTYAYEVLSGDKRNEDLQSLTLGSVTFGWSYWLAVAGGCCQLISAIGFGVSGARHHPYSHVI